MVNEYDTNKIIHINTIYEFFDKKIKSIDKNVINKNDFFKFAPKLSDKNTFPQEKVDRINKFGKTLTIDDMIEYFKYQLDSRDYINFDFLQDRLKLKTDETGMLIFNEQCCVEEININALITWWIVKIFKKNTMFDRCMYNESIYMYTYDRIDNTLKPFSAIYIPKLNIIISIGQKVSISVFKGVSLDSSISMKTRYEIDEMNSTTIYNICITELIEGISKSANHYKDNHYKDTHCKDNSWRTLKEKIYDIVDKSMSRFEYYREKLFVVEFKQTILNDLKILCIDNKRNIDQINKLSIGDTSNSVYRRFENTNIAIKHKLDIIRKLDNKLYTNLQHIHYVTMEDMINNLDNIITNIDPSNFPFDQYQGYDVHQHIISSSVINSHDISELKYATEKYINDIRSHYNESNDKITSFYNLMLK